MEKPCLSARSRVREEKFAGSRGERDLHVSVADAKRLKQAAPAAKLVLLPNANHFFKVVKSADNAANAAAYSKLVPLAPHIADEIADFVSAANSTQ